MGYDFSKCPEDWHRCAANPVGMTKHHRGFNVSDLGRNLPEKISRSKPSQNDAEHPAEP